MADYTLGVAVEGAQQAANNLGLVTAAIAAASALVYKSVDAFADFDQGLADLSSITGATGKDLAAMGESARDMGINVTGGATAALKAMEAIGSAKPELLQSTEALVAMTEAANVLAKASGDALPQAASNLTGIMNQFGASAEQADRYINVLAAGSLAGAANITELAQSMQSAGAMAAAFNVPIEETVAALETLADKSIKGAEAGTALRNILTVMSATDALPREALQQLEKFGVDLDRVSNKALPFNERLAELAKIGGDATAIVKVFGKENEVAALALLNNTQRANDLTKAVTGTNTAYDQAATRSATFKASMERLQNALQDGFIELGRAMVPFIQEFTTQLIPAIQAAIPYIKAFGDGVLQAKNSIVGAISQMLAPFKAIGEAIGSLVSAITGAVGVSFTFGDALEAVIAFTKPIRDGFTMGANAVAYLIEKFAQIIDQSPVLQAVISGISTVVETVVGWIGSLTSGAPNFLNTIIDVVDAIDSVLNPLRLVGTAWAYIFGDGSESIGGLAESTKGHLSALADMARTEFGASTEQIKAFAQSFDTAELAGKSTAEATDYLRQRFAAFMETCTATTDAATGTSAAIAGIGGAALPAAGSIDALNGQLSKLRDEFNATGSASMRMSLGQDIAELETTLERVTAQGAPLDSFIVKTQEANRALVDMGAVAQRSMRDASQLAADAAASFTAAEPAILSFKEKMIAALGEGAMGEIQQGLKNIGQAFMDFGATAAQSIGYAIGAGEDLGEAFRKSVTALLVEVPKLAGMALLNAAATTPSPASLPLAVAGLALLGLSGIVKGLGDANDAKLQAAKDAGAMPSLSSQAQSGGLTGLSVTESDPFAGRTIILNVDGREVEAAVTTRQNERERLKGN